jgi:hypothetical protein
VLKYTNKAVQIDLAIPLSNTLLLVFYIIVSKVKSVMKMVIRKTPGDLFFLIWWYFTAALYLVHAITPSHDRKIPVELWYNLYMITSIYITTRWPKFVNYWLWLVKATEGLSSRLKSKSRKKSKKGVVPHARPSTPDKA